MNRNRSNKIARAGHGLFLLLCAGCLIFFGLLANSALISVKEVKSDSSERPICCIDIKCLPDGDGSMAKGAGSSSGKVFHITIPAVVSGGGLDKRLPVQKIIEIRTSPRIICGQDALFSTAVTACPHKAREFTLIGAKPSGTS
jgi:hypothetical protein